MLCFWSASAALGAFLFIVVKPKVRAFEENGRKVCEQLWALMDQVAQRRTSLNLLGALVIREQRAFEELGGAASLEALERSCPDYQNAGFLLVALEADAGMLEAELELIKVRHGRFFYYCFLCSTVESAGRMVQSARRAKAALLSATAAAAVAAVFKDRS